MMKKSIILLLLMTTVVTANAQNLTIKQVMMKALSAMNTKNHCIKGNVTVKTLGISTTEYCAADGINSYSATLDGKKIIYHNKGVKYLYDKKKNTVTITNDKYVDPFFGDILDEIKDEPFDDKDDITMTLKNGEYTISGKEDGVKITFVIDAKTFFFKSLKMKKFLMSMEMKYSNLAYFTNRESLIYNASKFTGAKVIDKRKKK